MLAGRRGTGLPCHNHPWMSGRRAFAALACLLGLLRAPVWAGETSPTVLDPHRVAWRDLRYTAHKLGISATVEIRLEEAAAGSADGSEVRPRGTAPTTAEKGAILLESTSHFLGRTFLAHEHVDPVQAGAREIVDTETGAKKHRKTYWLTGRGFLFELVEPASESEVLLPPERWTRQTRSFFAYPKSLPAGAVITGPAGLLYAVSAAGLSSPGDSMDINVLVQTQVERVTVAVEGVEYVELDFQESSGGKLRAVRERVAALRLVARSQPVDPTSSSAFRIFGLGGEIELLWDPARRLPVEISGNVKVLGHVEVRLASAILR